MANPIENLFSFMDAEGVEARLHVLQDHFLDAKDSYDSPFIVDTVVMLRELINAVKYIEPKEKSLIPLKRVS